MERAGAVLLIKEQTPESMFEVVQTNQFLLPLKPAHTDGDLAVYFTKSNVWVFGDDWTNDYPSIDRELYRQLEQGTGAHQTTTRSLVQAVGRLGSAPT